MPAISFPPSPDDGDEYTANSRTWVFDASIPAWSPKLLPYAPEVTAHKSSHATGGADELTPADIGADPAGSAQAAQTNAASYTESYVASAMVGAEAYADAAAGAAETAANGYTDSAVSAAFAAAASLRLTPTAVASLPGAPVEGMVAYVNNALSPSVGAVVAGSGAVKCLVCYNGTSWLVTHVLNGGITVKDVTELVYSAGSSGTSKSLLLTNGVNQTVTMTGNCTFPMPTPTAGKSFRLYIYTGTGGFTGTFTSVKWPGGTSPTLTATASRLDIADFTSDGTSWYGAIGQNYTP